MLVNFRQHFLVNQIGCLFQFRGIAVGLGIAGLGRGGFPGTSRVKKNRGKQGQENNQPKFKF
jgi:hypothetical protein